MPLQLYTHARTHKQLKFVVRLCVQILTGDMARLANQWNEPRKYNAINGPHIPQKISIFMGLISNFNHIL
jgi:hypothetical protein